MTPFPIVAQGEDFLPVADSTAAYFQTVTREDALAAIKQLSQQESEDWFNIGRVLSAYRSGRTDSEWNDLLSYAEDNFQVNKRKAYYLIGIYESLSKSNIAVEQVKQIGWTKLKEIAHLLTQDNVEYWVQIATENSTKSLLALLKSKATADSKVAVMLDSHLSDTNADDPVTPSPDFSAADDVAEDGNYVNGADTYFVSPVVGVDLASGADITAVFVGTTDGGGEVFVHEHAVLPVEVPTEHDTTEHASLVAGAVGVLKQYSANDVIKAVSELFPNMKIVAKGVI